MKILIAFLSLVITCLMSSTSRISSLHTNTHNNDDSLKLFLPDDLQVELWAESPQFYNPTNIDVDYKGRIWVTEAANYRNYNNDPKKFLHHEKGDRVVILEDTDGDGKADKSKVFVQDTDLVSPLGIAVLGNKIIVSCSPNLIIYTDDNNDDMPDKKEIFLTGFGGKDHDHSLHSLVAGPDGNWYFNTGNAGPHIVTDHSGWTLRSGSLYTGGSPYNKQNHGGMISDDGKIWVGGLALRIKPDGNQLKVLAHNFRNSYELAIDSYGNMWQNDNDDQVVTCRTSWLMEGGNAGYFSSDGTRYWQADQRPGQSTFTAHWHQDDPGVMPACDNTGAGSPTGVVVNEGDALGKKYRGMLLSADAGRNVIFAYNPKPIGAGYALKHWSLLTSIPGENEKYVWNDAVSNQDKRKWFRPSDVAIGTDGAIYIADWYDPIVGGHQMKEQNGYGRIYRITPKGKRLPAPVFDLNTLDGQIQALSSDAINVRNLGFEKLKQQGKQAIPVVKQMLKSANPYHIARAAWLLSQLGEEGIRETEKLLTNSQPELRITAFRALRQVKGDIVPYVNKLADDTSAAVRREVAIALKNLPLADSKDVFVKLANSYNGNDRWFLEALGYAMEGQEDQLYPLLARRMADVNPIKWSQAFADLTWRLHPNTALRNLYTRALSTSLTESQRKQAVDAIAFIKNKEAVKAMKELASNPSKVVSDDANWWYNFRKTNDWFAFLEEENPSTHLAALENQKKMMSLQKQILKPSLALKEKQKLVVQMAKDSLGGKLLIDLAANGKLNTLLNQFISQHIFENPDKTVRVEAGEYFVRPGSGKKYSITSITKLKPDAQKGKSVFATSCSSCHKAGNTGSLIGPELTTIKNKYDRSTLLDAIINPSAGVVFGYEPWLLKTKDGKTFYGFLIADGQTVVIKDMAGKQQAIVADKIISRKKMPGSVMPDPGALGLSDTDLANLSEFLITLKANN